MLSAQEAKDARRSLGLSQKKVTEFTGISNTDISKLENGRMILPTDQMLTLIQFYQQEDAELPKDIEEIIADALIDEEDDLDIEETPDEETEGTDSQEEADQAALPTPSKALPVRKTHRHIDGILIPEAIPIEEAEALMEEYQTNKERIKKHLGELVPRRLLGDIALEDVMRHVLVPMAENFAIIDRIHGDTQLAKWQTIDDVRIHRDNMIDTYQDAVEHLFTTPYQA